MDFEVVENKEVAVKQKTEIIQPVTMETITEYLDSTGLTKQLLPKEKSMFVNMAQMFGLNPFKREIYCNIYGSGDYRTCAIVTGYEVYLKRAERTGKMDGWECTTNETDGKLTATVTIYRKDWNHPFRHTVNYAECVQLNHKTGKPNSIWAKMPVFMTKKVAMAQAFRLCFPDEFGGMPYTNDEIVNDDAAESDKMKSANIPSEENNNSVDDSGASRAFDSGTLTIRQKLVVARNKYALDLPEAGITFIDSVLADANSTDDVLQHALNRLINTLTKNGVDYEQ
jgi:phage recombination protein Bet